MSEWEHDDLVELRIRGEFVDVVGLLSTMTVGVIEGDENAHATRVAHDLAEQAKTQVNFGLAERQLKRIARNGDYDYRGIDVRVHDFDPRHPDERSELDVDKLPPFVDADSYAVVLKDEQGVHMAGYPDELTTEMGLQLASALRLYARDIEDAVVMEES